MRGEVKMMEVTLFCVTFDEMFRECHPMDCTRQHPWEKCTGSCTLPLIWQRHVI